MSTAREKVIEIFSGFATDREDLSLNFHLPVTQEDIDQAQAKCSVEFPEDLKDFWLTCGWGIFFVSKDKIQSDNDNCFLSPDTVQEILNKNIEEGYEEVEVNHGFIPFFNMFEDSFRGLKEQSSGDRRIYGFITEGCKPEILADDIWEFALKFWDDPDWLLKIEWDFFRDRVRKRRGMI